MTTVYITKWALSSGIQIMETDSDINDKMISVKIGDSGYPTYFHGRDWHTTPLDAITRAEAMRAKKIDSLRKSLTKMEALTFHGDFEVKQP